MHSLPDTAKMRRKLRRLSMIVGILISVFIPAGYLLASLVHADAMLSELSDHASERIAQYAYTQGPTWEYAPERLASILHPRAHRHAWIMHTIVNADGLEIVRQGDVSGPLWRVTTPILVGGVRVGDLETTVSLIPTLWQGLLAVLIGAGLGGTVYLVVHLLPMRSLDRALAELQTALVAKHQLAAETAGAYQELEASYRALEETKHDLENARNRAKAADRSKSAFLASMSHELRTPLNAIIGFSEMISSEIFGPLGHAKYREYASDIRDSGQHLVDLVGDVLDLSKIEVGKLNLSLGPVEIPHVLAECIRVMRGRAEESAIKLRIEEVPTELPIIVADELRLKQILLNLLSNSWKFTPEGGSITVAADAAVRGFVRIRVTDTGIGMDRKDLRRVMNPFEQAEGQNYAKMEGSGLGLPLARALARQHGGDLVLESILGKGTTATVTLPVSAVPPRNPLEVRAILENQDRVDRPRSGLATGRGPKADHTSETAQELTETAAAQ